MLLQSGRFLRPFSPAGRGRGPLLAPSRATQLPHRILFAINKTGRTGFREGTGIPQILRARTVLSLLGSVSPVLFVETARARARARDRERESLSPLSCSRQRRNQANRYSAASVERARNPRGGKLERGPRAKGEKTGGGRDDALR